MQRIGGGGRIVVLRLADDSVRAFSVAPSYTSP